MSEITIGTALELPEGVFNVVGQWRYRGTGLHWSLFELDDGEGQTQLLAQVDEDYYRPRWETIDALPEQETLELEGVRYALRQHGEARVERSTADEHDFWLAEFRQYVTPGRIAIFTRDRDEIHRLLGEELDGKLVQVYAQS